LPMRNNLSRRTLAVGAAWAMPVVALSTAAPAVASSLPCPPLSVAPADWTNVNDANHVGAPSSGASIWLVAPNANAGRFRMYSDSESATVQKVTSTSSTLTGLTVGRSYTIAFDLQTGKGYVPTGTCATVWSSLKITVGASTAWTGTTQTGTGPAGAVVVAPPVNCTVNGTRSATWSAVTTFLYTFTASATTMSIKLEFTMGTTTAGNNDDWLVRPRYTYCAGAIA
jgi:hypothetical protein